MKRHIALTTAFRLMTAALNSSPVQLRVASATTCALIRSPYSSTIARHAGEVGLQRDERPERLGGIREARMRLLDDTAEVVLEHLDRLADDLAHLGVDRRIAPVGAVGDAQAAKLARMRGLEPADALVGQRVTVAHIGAGDGREHQRAVGHRAGSSARCAPSDSQPETPG